MIDLTTEEKRAIAALKRIAAKWPKSLWLFSGSGNLHVMKCDEDGSRKMTPVSGGCGGSVDGEQSVATIRIPNDGGDW